MSDLHKVRKYRPPQASTPRQRTMAFESRLTRGLTSQERIKVVRQLAHLLILAADMTLEESNRER